MRRLVGIAVVVFPLLRQSSQDDLVEMGRVCYDRSAFTIQLIFDN